MKNILILFIKFYKYFLSPIFGRQCRFYPSCSEYSIQAIKNYKTGKAIRISILRILRCNPLSKGGHDPLT